jgi:hypothetical protein
MVKRLTVAVAMAFWVFLVAGPVTATTNRSGDFEDQCAIYSDPDGWVGQTRQFVCDQESQYSGWHWDSAEEDVEEMLYQYCVTRHPGSYSATVLSFNFLESPSHSMDGASGEFRCAGIWD